MNWGLRQDCREFKASLGYMVTACLREREWRRDFKGTNSRLTKGETCQEQQDLWRVAGEAMSVLGRRAVPRADAVVGVMKCTWV